MAIGASVTNSISNTFRNPPEEFCPVPFWWWSGGDLRVEQLKWQLDQLAAKGIKRAIIGYSHLPDASLDQGHPALWTEEWWMLLLEVLDHARGAGISLGIQDYIILNESLAGAGRPGATLHHLSSEAPAQREITLQVPHDGTPLEASARRGSDQILLTDQIEGGAVRWTPDDDGWSLHLVFTRKTPFDPLAVGSGDLSLSLFQQKVANRIGDHLGTTFNTFFQDELDFHGRWPFWSNEIPELFALQHGYRLEGRLAALWHGNSGDDVQVRLDFHDTAVGLLEHRYFKPIKDWHDRNGCLFGHDNAGRGAVGRGRDFYGDYMRTMRWYSAPGSDDPDLYGTRAFEGLKVSSSIATLYSRPRVWAECFHSSGWGATTDALLSATNSVFALGANLINLHGLYSSTQGSWWEWAPPDFHFRQPYWACMDVYSAYVSRLSWLMSQGLRRGDAVVLYPTLALAGRLNEAVSPASETMAYSEQQRGEAPPPIDKAELACFNIAKALFNDGVDVNFIDDCSIENATFADGLLHAGAGAWRTVILADMTAIRVETLKALQAFRAGGGRVVIIGAPPRATNSSEFQGRELSSLVSSLATEQVEVLDRESILQVVPMSVRATDARSLQVVRRQIDSDDVYILHNASDKLFRGKVALAGYGSAARLDPLTGSDSACVYERIDATALRVELEIAPNRLAIIRIGEHQTPAEGQKNSSDGLQAKPVHSVVLDGPWQYSLVPTLDNRHADFASEAKVVGLELNRFRWREESISDWVEVAPTHAPRYLEIGPIGPSDDLEQWIAGLSRTPVDEQPMPFLERGQCHAWRERLVSPRDGILDDPWLKHWSSGPHGLKNTVPDDFIDGGESLGSAAFIVTGVITSSEPTIFVASQAAYQLWVDGELVAEQPDALIPRAVPPWNLPSYDAPSRDVQVAPGKPSRFVLCLKQPNPQRVRAHLGIGDAPAPVGRGHRFLADERLSLVPTRQLNSDTQLFEFAAPPGFTAFTVRHRGHLSATRDGRALEVTSHRTDESWQLSRITGGLASDGFGQVQLRIVGTGACRAGDAISTVVFENPNGTIGLGDWCAQGLASYSGGVRYSTSFELPVGVRQVRLETGPIGSCCIVNLNGSKIGTLLGAPWELDVSRHAREGGNELELIVYNTLANHFVENTPSPFAYRGQTASGLLSVPRVTFEMAS